MKNCVKKDCEQINPQSLENFGKNKLASDGLHSYCKKCKYKCDLEYQRKNKDKRKIISKRYYDKNVDKYKAYKKKYRLKNWDKIKEKNHEYYLNNIEHKQKYKKEYVSKNREKLREQERNYLANNIQAKLKTRLRSRLCHIIRGQIKSGSAVDDLGCSIEEFKLYLESKFQEGMSWNNYGNKEGQWSIDHIIPLSRFNLKDRGEFLKANNYNNLQPMWHIDNMKKGNRDY